MSPYVLQNPLFYITHDILFKFTLLAILATGTVHSIVCNHMFTWHWLQHTFARKPSEILPKLNPALFLPTSIELDN